MFARMEWLILELLVVAWAVWELISVRRSIRRDREAKAKLTPPPAKPVDP